jgi:4-hydroxybenzoate polyprenyltransferase
VTGPPPPARGRAGEFGRFLEIQNLGLNLSFAVGFLLAAADGIPSVETLVLVVVAFVAARNAGHSFNRWADRRFDALNPRTRDRALVTGRYSPRFALAVAAASGAVLIGAAYLLNWLAFLLAPVALVLLFGYSYTKRYTAGTTAVLGLVESMTPAAAYVAVTATLPVAAWVAAGGILLWGTAFETVHSLGDIEADRAAGLRSIPVAIGRRASLGLVPVLHGAALVALAVFGYLAGLAPILWGALLVMALFAAAADVALARRPEETGWPFRIHFLQGLIFLAGVAAALFVPAG